MSTFKPQHRYSYALEQFKREDKSESHYRSVIHLSYYAAFNQLQHEIDNRLFFPMDENDRFERSHQAVIDACENQIRKLPASEKGKKEILTGIANTMRRARKLRRNADYSFDRVIMECDAQTSLSFAQVVFEQLELYE